MKKTTTRLATAATVLIMSLFAVALAHYDARKRDQNDDGLLLASGPALPPTPLDIEGNWPGQNAIVRANNADVDQPLDVANVEFNPPRELLTADAHEFPLDAVDLSPDWEVITASGEGATTGSGAAGERVLQPGLPNGFPAAKPQPVATLGAPEPGQNGLPSTDLLPLPTLGESAAESPSAGWAAGAGGGSLPAWPGSREMSSSLPAATTAHPEPPAGQQAWPSARSEPPSNYPPPKNAADGERSGAAMAEQRGSSGAASSQHLGGQYAGTVQPGAPSSAAINSPSGLSAGMHASLATAGSGAAQSNTPLMNLVSNQPGSRYLDGSQNPVMQIHKRAPEEIQVGKRATFIITVRNAGSATAHDVTVSDRVPRGARFAEASPNAVPAADGTLTWILGEMAGGDERTISLQIIPEMEGEVGSVASVHFAAQASVRTVATLPQLTLQVESTGPVIIGQAMQIVVMLSNAGSGVARAVRLEADIPPQLRHESGETQLEAYVGDLRPNESRRLTLNIAAVQPGQAQCLLRAIHDDAISSEQSIAVDVRAPQLTATINGPSLRYLERQANYQVLISNTGTAMARNLDFVVHLPVGLKFVSVDIPQATYHPQSHSITLGLAELDSGQAAPFTVSVLPVQLGPQVIRLNASGDLNISAEAKSQVTVAGLAELAFTIGQDNGTVEVGASTTYAVQVTNVGNQPDKNVQLQVQLPEGSKLVQVDAPVDYRVDGGRTIVFSPIGEMRHRDLKTFRFQVQHDRAGNQVVRSQLTSENWPVAVVKEEGTLVYNDRN